MIYHGSLPRADKERAIAAFRDEAPVLLSTESAGEGRNLQFCHVMVNMDLPWNPMQIEQRLGRLHRVGQDHDVLLTNLVASGTIEEHVLRVLEAKINLFELVIGELDRFSGGWTTTSTSRPRCSTRSWPPVTTRSSASGWRSSETTGQGKDRLSGQPRRDR